MITAAELHKIMLQKEENDEKAFVEVLNQRADSLREAAALGHDRMTSRNLRDIPSNIKGKSKIIRGISIQISGDRMEFWWGPLRDDDE
jgi:hypothetical protein